MDLDTYKQVIKKKEFSKLPKKDVERAFGLFEKREVSEREKIRLTREMLHKVFSSFTSQKILSLKDKSPEWILRKHLSTRERLGFYEKLYSRLLKGFEGASVFDFGAGINGFSYSYFPKGISYFGIEAMGQLVELMNYYFKAQGLEGIAIHESLFELEKVKKYLKQVRGKKILFLFKVVDGLEMLERNYSKKLLEESVPLVNKVVFSFATKSMINQKRFRAKRDWILNFIKERFKILDDFELGSERYVVFKKK